MVIANTRIVIPNRREATVRNLLLLVILSVAKVRNLLLLAILSVAKVRNLLLLVILSVAKVRNLLLLVILSVAKDPCIPAADAATPARCQALAAEL